MICSYKSQWYPAKLMRYCLGTFFLLALFVTGCKRHYVAPTQYPYRFINHDTMPLILDLYGSQEDYANNVNRLQRHLMAVGDTQEVIIDVGRTYWYDWYSSDYRFSNWAVTDYNDRCQIIEFGKTALNERFRTQGPDTIRSILLRGDGISSAWKGVDTAADSLNGIHQFLFRKDKTGTHIFQDKDVVTTLPFTYEIFAQQGSFGPIEWFMLTIYEAGSLDRSYTVYCKLSNGYPSLPVTGPDTFQITRPHTEISFFVGRQ